MSFFGEKVEFTDNWNHLEYYVIPSYSDVRNSNFDEFPKFKLLYNVISKLYELEFTASYDINGHVFKVLPNAWGSNKESFMQDVSGRHFRSNDINEEEKKCAELLVDAFNRHPWRAAFFISAIMSINILDYRTWDKKFFCDFYDSGNKLKGYSPKVVACFLQQGFGNEEAIPVDTWIETFFRYPLGISSYSSFFKKFDHLGKLERVIWLASQSNKTNMKEFYDVLWCQRYGINGNNELRGVNPLACYLCKLKGSCVGLSNDKGNLVYVANAAPPVRKALEDISFYCELENNVPKKVYVYKKPKGKKKGKKTKRWILIDEFSGYLMNNGNVLPDELVSKKRPVLSIDDFLNSLGK